MGILSGIDGRQGLTRDDVRREANASLDRITEQYRAARDRHQASRKLRAELESAEQDYRGLAGALSNPAIVGYGWASWS